MLFWVIAVLNLFAVISNTPQVSVTEYNKLQAEIKQLKRDLQVEYDTVNPVLSLQGAYLI